MVAVVVAHAQADRAEVHEPRVERVVRAERTRPIAAVVARFVHEVTVAAIARQREEDGVAVCAGYNSSFYAFKPFRFFSNDFFLRVSAVLFPSRRSTQKINVFLFYLLTKVNSTNIEHTNLLIDLPHNHLIRGTKLNL